MVSLIHRLAELSHLTPDEIVAEITDPLATPIRSQDIGAIPLRKLRERGFAWVRSDMSRFDSYSVRNPSYMNRDTYTDMIAGEYSGWSIIGFEYRHRPGIGLPPCERP